MEVRDALLALNGPGQPFVVRDGRGEGVELIAEWKIADARWFGFFGRVGTVNRTMLRFADDVPEVRALDQEWTVTWLGDGPRLQLGKSYSRGRMSKRSVSWTFARDENGKLVKESSSSFATGAMRSALQDRVTGLGWSWRGVLLGKL